MPIRLPLMLLSTAVVALALGGGLATFPGGGGLAGHLLRVCGGGLLLFLFPAFSVLYRRRPAGARSTPAALLLCALVNPMILALGAELMVLVGISHSPIRIALLSILPALAIEWALRRERPFEGDEGGLGWLGMLPAAAVLAVLVADPRTRRIDESRLLPDQTHELLASLAEGTGIGEGMQRDPRAGAVVETPVEGVLTRSWTNTSDRLQQVELRWLLHNPTTEEQDVTVWADRAPIARYRVPARFEAHCRPRDYPPSNALVVERLALGPGEHTVELHQERGTPPLTLLDLTGVPREQLFEELHRRYAIADVGDVQQVLDIARNFDHGVLPRVGNPGQALSFVGGSVTITDLPLYHLVLNLALNLISDDLAGANALFVGLLGWILLGLLVVFDPRGSGRGPAWALGTTLVGAVTLVTWRLLRPNDEALFLDAYMTLAGVALVAFVARRCILGGAVAALVIAGTMRAGQLWMALSALSVLALDSRQWRGWARLFGPSLVLSAVIWLVIAVASRDPVLGQVFGGVLAEDVADRFFYFSVAADLGGFVRERWLVHTLQFLGFCLAGSGGLLVVGLVAGRGRIRGLAAGLALYLIALALLAHHRVAYTVPFVVVGIAVGLAALGGPRRAEGPRWRGSRAAIAAVALFLVVANALSLSTTTDDYTRTDGSRVLWYATYPGESARWLALEALRELENDRPQRAHDLLVRAVTLYPYHLPHLGYQLGRAALAQDDPGRAEAMFGIAARLEEQGCVQTHGGALLLAAVGEGDRALRVMRLNPSCSRVPEHDAFAEQLARVAEGTEDVGPLLQRLPDDRAVRDCYLTDAFGWPYRVPLSPPLP